MNGAPVSWWSHQQTLISKSSTEAKYISASKAVCDLVWLNDLLLDAGLLPGEGPRPLHTSKLLVDNKGAVDLTKSEALTWCSSHIEICYHIICNWANKGEIDVQHVAGTANQADSLTKPSPAGPYWEFCDAIGIRSSEAADTTELQPLQPPTIHTA